MTDKPTPSLHRPLFSKGEYLDFVKLFAGKTLKEITYHTWHNMAREEDPISFIYLLEIEFSDSSKVQLTSGEEEARLTTVPIDIEQEKKDLIKGFSNQLWISSAVQNDNEMWKELVGKEVLKLEMSEEPTGAGFFADQFLLHFSEHSLLIEIGLEGDGLEVNWWENEEDV